MSIRNALNLGGAGGGVVPISPNATVATTGNLIGTYDNGASGVGATITITATGTLTIDGVLTALNNDILVKNQTTEAQNGVYTITTAGAPGIHAVLTRRSDFNSSTNIKQYLLIGVDSGSQANTSWYESAPGPFIVGTTAITFAEYNVGVSSVTTDTPESLNVSPSTGAVVIGTTQGIGTTSSPTFVEVKAKGFLNGVITANMDSDYTIDPTLGSTFILTWNTDTVLSFNSPTLPAGYTRDITVIIIPDSGAGAYTIFWNLGVNLVSSNLPLIDQTPGKPTVLKATYANGSWQLTDSGSYNQPYVIPSADTVNFDVTSSNLIIITGNTNINTIISGSGEPRIVFFNENGGVLVNSLGIQLPGSANITWASGDAAIFIGYATNENGTVYCVSYSRIDGTPVHPLGTMASQNANAVAITGGTISNVDISGGSINGTGISGGVISGATFSAGIMTATAIDSSPIGNGTPDTVTGTFVRQSVSAAISAAGTNQGTATALTKAINNVTTVASGTGVKLPAAVVGDEITVYNNGANALQLYSNSSETLNGTAGSTGVTIPVGTNLTLQAISTSAWQFVQQTGAFGTMALQNSNSVSISGGAIDGTTIGGSTPAVGTFTFAKQSLSASITSAGSNQSGATALASAINNVNLGSAGSGVKLMASTSVVGGSVAVFNNTGNTINVYSNGSETINGIAGSVGVSLANGQFGVFYSISSSAWDAILPSASAIDNGYFLAPAIFASTSNLSATYNNGTSGVGATLTNNTTQSPLFIDGAATAVGDSILIGNQTAAEENGVYIVTNTGSISTNWILTRRSDFNSASTIQYGAQIIVLAGTSLGGTQWYQNTITPLVVGTSPIYFLNYPQNVVNSISGNYVDNTDPANPIVKSFALEPCVVCQYGAPVNPYTYNNGTSGVGATITSNSNGALVIDGVTMSVGDSVLWNELVVLTHNGIYTVTATGTPGTPYVLTRRTDYDTSEQVFFDSYTYIRAGDTYSGSFFSMANDVTSPIVIGTDDIPFYQTTIANIFGTMAYQNATNVAISGGTIDGTAIGGTTTAAAQFTVPVNAQTGTTYTFVASDIGKTVTFNNASAITVTIPENGTLATVNGTQFYYRVLGAGAVTFVTQGTDILKGNTLAKTNASGTISKYASGSWFNEGGTSSLTGQFCGPLITAVANQKYLLVPIAKSAFTITGFVSYADSLVTAGTYTIKINATAVTGLNGITVTAASTETSATAANVVSPGDEVSITFAGSSTIVNFFGQLSVQAYQNV